MKILFVDGANLIHRARFGFADGEYNIVYNFFRSFRALVELMKPEKIIFAMEGFPEFRHQLYPDYKANRHLDPNDLEAQDSFRDFRVQRQVILELLSKLPIELIQHPKYEADDLIGKLVSSVYREDDSVIITADTDYYQLLDSQHDLPNLKIYNPIKKAWVEPLDYDYVLHKSLVGDTADNIKGIPKVGVKTAEKLLKKSPAEFESWLNEKQERRAILERNRQLVSFADVPITEIKTLQQEVDWEFIRKEFEKMNFKSMLTEKAWNKFQETFSF